ncbi:hypothetical protein PTKIN_Ptkin07bG0278300 [Pterospermum kingtungense]
MKGHAKTAAICRLPLIAIMDAKHPLKDIPVCQVPGDVEYHPRTMVYGKKWHPFLIVYEFSGARNEVVLYWELRCSIIGPSENQFATLDEDKSGPVLYIRPGATLQEAVGKNGAVEPNLLRDQPGNAKVNFVQGPMQFLFETQVNLIFSTPIESTLMFACYEKQIGLAKLVQGYRLSTSMTTVYQQKTEGKKCLRLKANEIVLQILNYRYGQFDIAKETFEVIADYESMLELFICHLNPSAMRCLSQRMEEEGADSELR